MNIVKIPTFNIKDLHGSVLKIYASETEDGTVVVGIEEDTDKIYVLHMEIKEETPVIINTDLPNINGRGTRPVFSKKKPPKPPRGRLRKAWN